jgi:cysteinyl-tRNA synthetase
MHGNMLTLNGKKMSKSTGNSILPAELFSGNNEFMEKPFGPMVVRFFMMQAHYRSPLDFTSEALTAAEKGYDKLMEAMRSLEVVKAGEQSSVDVKAMVASFYEAMNDDFNAPILVAKLFDAVKYINSIKDGNQSIGSADLQLLQKEMNAFVVGVLGIRNDSSSSNGKLNPVMDLVLDLRQEARANKDWSTSDKIRDGLANAGIVVKDTKDGTSWS